MLPSPGVLSTPTSPPHETHELPDDGKAHARPFSTVPFGSPHPLEGKEDSLPIFRRDALPCIDHRETELERLVVFRAQIVFDGDDAIAGVPNRVDDQIVEHLA